MSMSAPKPDIPADPRSDAELSQFLLQACHDLRGPLRAIRTHVELLAKSGPSASASPGESFGFIVNSSVSAGRVVDGLTEYALALAIDRSRFQPAPLDIIVRAAMAKLAAQIRENDAEVVYGELPTVTGDWDRLQQLFEYLLDHALRYRGPERPSIRISAEAVAGEWQFAICDNGMGMDEESIAKAFVPFARLHSNQRPGPGLAVCRVIVEKHGGKIWGEPGAHGCTFRFTLPTE